MVRCKKMQHMKEKQERDKDVNTGFCSDVIVCWALLFWAVGGDVTDVVVKQPSRPWSTTQS